MQGGTCMSEPLTRIYKDVKIVNLVSVQIAVQTGIPKLRFPRQNAPVPHGFPGRSVAQ